MNATTIESVSQSAARTADALPMASDRLLKRYEGRTVLDGVSLTLQPGSVLGLIGRNGAGKSTLIRAMLGLLQPDGGGSTVWGQPALGMDDVAKARLAYVPQNPDALPWMKLGDMLDFVGRFYPRWDVEFVDATLDRWGLLRNRMLDKLSPGERQRVAIIRALASRPELLVLDEPAAALDPVARRELLREIAARAGEAGATVLFSSHIVSDLERVASHVAFLHDGRLLLDAEEMDTLKERHLRAHLPADAVSALRGPAPGEIARRLRPDGTATVVLLREPDQPWPPLVSWPGVRTDVLSLENLFIEVAA